MSNNQVHILNFNHNNVNVVPENNLIIITDNNLNKPYPSINIPQPVTKILQINTPGPQGPAGTGGGGSIDTGSFATTGSNTFTSNQIVSGSITTNNNIIIKHYPGGFIHATEDYQPGSIGTILYTSVGAQTGNTFVELAVRQGGGTLSSGVLALNANGGGSVTIGKSTATPDSVLDINGNTVLSGSLTISGSLKQNGYEVKPYKAYTALLTQNGGDTPQDWDSGSGPLILGYTYQINSNDGGTADFTNIGAPNNEVGTYFVATGTIPNSWGVSNNGGLSGNGGAPVATVLENTLGNIWFTFNNADGEYQIKSNGLFINNKTWIICPASTGQGNTNILGVTNVNTIELATSNNSDILVNTLLDNTSIEIRVYN